VIPCRYEPGVQRTYDDSPSTTARHLPRRRRTRTSEIEVAVRSWSGGSSLVSGRLSRSPPHARIASSSRPQRAPDAPYRASRRSSSQPGQPALRPSRRAFVYSDWKIGAASTSTITSSSTAIHSVPTRRAEHVDAADRDHHRNLSSRQRIAAHPRRPPRHNHDPGTCRRPISTTRMAPRASSLGAHHRPAPAALVSDFADRPHPSRLSFVKAVR